MDSPKTPKKYRCACGNWGQPGRKRCQNCRVGEWRAQNPVLYAYHTLKSNAKRRNKLFNLTITEFTRFAIEVDLVRKQGRDRLSYHIDRIRDAEGYTADNIQLLPGPENVAKENRRRQRRYVYDEVGRTVVCVTDLPPALHDCPF